MNTTIYPLSELIQTNYRKWRLMCITGGIHHYFYKRLGKKAIAVQIDWLNSKWYFFSDRTQEYFCRKFYSPDPCTQLVLGQIELEINNYSTHCRFAVPQEQTPSEFKAISFYPNIHKNNKLWLITIPNHS